MLFLDSIRDSYSIEECKDTMTIGELIDFLQDFNKEDKIYIRSDSYYGYIYGSISRSDFEEE